MVLQGQDSEYLRALIFGPRSKPQGFEAKPMPCARVLDESKKVATKQASRNVPGFDSTKIRIPAYCTYGSDSVTLKLKKVNNLKK